MNRVETAIQEGRCVLAIGGKALARPEVQAELRRRAIPAVALGAAPVNPVVAASAESLHPVLSGPGGVLVLVEPEPGVDGKALADIEKIVQSAGRNKPRLVVAARAFNPFGLPMALRLLKLDQEKKRAVDFLASLPVPTGSAPPSADNVAPGTGPAVPRAPVKPKKQRRRAPLPVFVGREEELATLQGMIAEDGGPIVVTGPPGVGRRWLVEKALDGCERTRLPNLVFARGTGADTLFARLALTAQSGGDSRLAEALTADPPMSPVELAPLIVDTLTGEAFADKVVVFERLHDLQDRRDGSFYRNGRLETVLRAVFQSTPALRIIAISDLPVTFYREGEGHTVRHLPLEGLKGKELHELYAAHNVEEFPRDRFGPIFERTHGHPLANRFLALAVARDGDVDRTLGKQRFLKADNIGDLAALDTHIRRRFEKVDKSLRDALAAVAMCRSPINTDAMSVLGINRNTRIDLLAQGWLEQTPHSENRCYYVHPMIRAQLTLREIEDFRRLEDFGHHLHQTARALKGEEGRKDDSFALAQEGNRMLVAARRGRSALRLPFPDADAQIDEIRGLMRRREPRLDIARARINEWKKKVSGNTELLLAEAELMIAEKADKDAIEAAFNTIATSVPTPEVFHTWATWHQSRSARGKAATALEQGIATFPTDARLHRRLAGFYLGMNRQLDAIDVLKKASDLEPMMPDTYGMLGEIYLELGTNRWQEAADCIAEARRLAPENPNHLAREAHLLICRSMVESEQADALMEQAEALLREAVALDKSNRRVLVLLARVIIDRNGDLDNAQWLLKRAMKREGGRRRREAPGAVVQRARLLVRQAAFDEAARLIQRALKSSDHDHTAHAAQGELFLAKGDLLAAHAAWQAARARTPKFAPEVGVYDATLAGLQARIEAGESVAPAAPVSPEPTTPQAQAGTREGDTILRKAGDDAPAAPAEAAPEAAPAEAAPAEAAPAEATEAPAEAAPAEATEAPAEAAPADATEAPTEATEPHAVAADESVADAPTAE